jgi:hypothetical protein
MKKLIFLLAISTSASAAFAQAGKQVPKRVTDSVLKTVYTCTMHPEVISDKPGKCPKCGMDLVAKKVKIAKEMYTCPMHPDVISDKPGKCPKCGMQLVKKRDPASDGKMQ